METEVTVILPTTGDRAAIVEIALRSIMAQTTEAFEVFIVGDGATGDSVARLQELAAADPRIHLRLFPKGKRRGEINRHKILTEEARGKIVAYITDRDLWLDYHLESVIAALTDADFTHTLTLNVDTDGSITIPRILDLSIPQHRESVAEKWRDRFGIPFSGAAHTLDAYKRLPEGWATTPTGHLTDVYMWRKFIRQPWLRAVTCFRPTYLYFRRGGFPGPPVEERRVELLHWEENIIRERSRNFQGFYEAGIDSLYRSRGKLLEKNLQLRGDLYHKAKRCFAKLLNRITSRSPGP